MLKRAFIRTSLAMLLCASSVPPAVLSRETGAPDFDGIKDIVRELASKPYVPNTPQFPRRLRDLTYDQLRDIRYNPKEAVWRRERLPFQLQFFHPGGLNRDQIDYTLVDGDTAREFPFSRDLFDYGANKFGWLDLRHLKFSGMRIHYPLNRQEYLDELVVFLGATYFRALPQHLVYGLSARAVALNCGVDDPEEFPAFRDIWVYRPGMDGDRIKVVGLFDSPSLAGAASFIIKPGLATVMDTTVFVAARTNISHLGIAPLTSMFWFGKNGICRFDDYRPEVHDSDGLLIQNSKDEWLWRPLENNGKLRLSSFADMNPKGFGLLQRERSFAYYQDLEALYHMRPSAWITPRGDWGSGSVRLVEIPTGSEFQDNIVAFWERKEPLKPNETAEYSYQISWFCENPALPSLGRTISMRTGALPGHPRSRKFVLDFKWPVNDPQSASGLKLDPVITTDRGNATGISSHYNADARSWRLAFDVAADEGATTVELRAHMTKDGKPCTETWTYLWMP